MIVNVYSIRDYKSGFNAPTFENNDAVAMRNFANACMQKGSVLSNFSDDFELWLIGKFDTENGQLTVDNIELFKPICKASDFKTSEV